MSNSTDDEPKTAGEKILENFLRGPFVPDEEFEENAAASGKLEGTSRETAYLNDESMLVMHYWTQKDYAVSDGWAHIMPGDADYEELCNKHGLKKPGDANQIVMRFINGEWVEEKQDKSSA